MAKTKFASTDNLSFDILISRDSGDTIDDLLHLGMSKGEASVIMHHLKGGYPSIYATKRSTFSEFSLNISPRNTNCVMKLKDVLKYDKYKLSALNTAILRYGSVTKARMILESTDINTKDVIRTMVNNIIRTERISTPLVIDDTFIDKCISRYSKENIIMASFDSLYTVEACNA